MTAVRTLEPSRKKRPAAASVPARGLSVLLVEDSAVDAALVSQLLRQQRAGAWTVVVASTLAEGLARLAAGGTDVVLLDLSLPDSRGLATFMRVAEAAPRVPVVVMSASDDERLAIEAVRLGAQDYLIKGQAAADSLARSIRYAVERHRLVASLRELSLVDDLTGLYNRRGFGTLGTAHLQLAQRAGRRFLLVYADVDGLKEINDSFGHQQGDVALVKTAEVLRWTFRQSDIVARLGGDEFVVLAVEAAQDTDQMFVDRLRAQIEEFNSRASLPFELSLSVGAVSFDVETRLTLSEMLAQADALLYERKRARKRGAGR
jgi:diguanylate cyclase (GGDEF)-like protein